MNVKPNLLNAVQFELLHVTLLLLIYQIKKGMYLPPFESAL
jgi:hypothetical protein